MDDNRGWTSAIDETEQDERLLASTTARLWTVNRDAHRSGFTGEIATQGSPLVRLYYLDGEVYFAERSDDPPLHLRLVAEGIVTAEQLDRGGVQIGESIHLGRLFERDASIDRDRVELWLDVTTGDLLASVGATPTPRLRVRPLQHHTSGVHHWKVHPAVRRELATAVTVTTPAAASVAQPTAQDADADLMPMIEPQDTAWTDAPSMDEPALEDTAAASPITQQVPAIIAEFAAAAALREAARTTDTDELAGAPADTPSVEATHADVAQVDSAQIDAAQVDSARAEPTMVDDEPNPVQTDDAPIDDVLLALDVQPSWMAEPAAQPSTEQAWAAPLADDAATTSDEPVPVPSSSALDEVDALLASVAVDAAPLVTGEVQVSPVPPAPPAEDMIELPDADHADDLPMLAATLPSLPLDAPLAPPAAPAAEEVAIAPVLPALARREPSAPQAPADAPAAAAGTVGGPHPSELLDEPSGALSDREIWLAIDALNERADAPVSADDSQPRQRRGLFGRKGPRPPKAEPNGDARDGAQPAADSAPGIAAPAQTAAPLAASIASPLSTPVTASAAMAALPLADGANADSTPLDPKAAKALEKAAKQRGKELEKARKQARAAKAKQLKSKRGKAATATGAAAPAPAVSGPGAPMADSTEPMAAEIFAAVRSATQQGR